MARAPTHHPLPDDLRGEVACFDSNGFATCRFAELLEMYDERLRDRIHVDFKLYEFKETEYLVELDEIKDYLNEPCIAIGLDSCLPTHWDRSAKYIVAYRCMPYLVDQTIIPLIDGDDTMSIIYLRDYELVESDPCD